MEITHGSLEGRVKGMYIMGENPFLSDPNVNVVRKALANLEFLVVQDIFLTETAEFADEMTELAEDLEEPVWGAEAQAKLPFTKTDVFYLFGDDALYVAAKRPALAKRKGECLPWRAATSGPARDISQPPNSRHHPNRLGPAERAVVSNTISSDYARPYRCTLGGFFGFRA